MWYVPKTIFSSKTNSQHIFLYYLISFLWCLCVCVSLLKNRLLQEMCTSIITSNMNFVISQMNTIIASRYIVVVVVIIFIHKQSLYRDIYRISFICFIRKKRIRVPVYCRCQYFSYCNKYRGKTDENGNNDRMKWIPFLFQFFFFWIELNMWMSYTCKKMTEKRERKLSSHQFYCIRILFCCTKIILHEIKITMSSVCLLFIKK